MDFKSEKTEELVFERKRQNIKYMKELKLKKNELTDKYTHFSNVCILC